MDQIYLELYNANQEKGSIVCNQLRQLIVNRTIECIKFYKTNYANYQQSLVIYIKLHVKDITLNGVLVISLLYLLRAVPLLFLYPEECKTIDFNGILNSKNIVETKMYKEWSCKYSLKDFIEDVVELLSQRIIREPSYPNEEIEEYSDDESESDMEEDVLWRELNEQIRIIPIEELTEGEQIEKTVVERTLAGIWNDNGIKRDVILKEFKISNSKQMMRLKRAIEIQHSLTHPNCHQFYGISVVDNRKIILVMERAKCTLEDITTKREYNNQTNQQRIQIQELDMNEKIRIIKEIAQGLAYIHSRGFIHGDIRVGNIMMYENNGTMHPKITNFGISKAYNTEATTISFLGTPNYVAPELTLSAKASTKIDCYAFGCMMVEIFSEKNCYFDYKMKNIQLFFKDVRDGLRPSIPSNLPEYIKATIEDLFKPKDYRLSMEDVIRQISRW